MTVKRITKSGDEADVVSPKARRVRASLQRPGATSRVKKKINRRERHDAKRDIRQED